jgi:hypothetical protein
MDDNQRVTYAYTVSTDVIGLLECKRQAVLGANEAAELCSLPIKQSATPTIETQSGIDLLILRVMGPESARDRDEKNGSALTVQKPRTRRQEPCHIQCGADSADNEPDEPPLLDVRRRECRQQIDFIRQRLSDGQYCPPIIAVVAPDLPTTSTHLLPAPYPPDTARRPRSTSTKCCYPKTQSAWCGPASSYQSLVTGRHCHGFAGQCPETVCVKHQEPVQSRCTGRCCCAGSLAEPQADPSSPRYPRAQTTMEAAYPHPPPRR